jgi:rhodanese-related sulfurtransferase
VNRMLLLLTTTLLFHATSTFAAPEPPQASARTKAGLYVTPTEAYEMLTNQKDRKVVLVDVRDPVEIMFTGFTDMADINIPLKIIDPSTWDEESGSYQANTNRDFVAETAAALERLGADKDSDIIFMCRSGTTRSGPAADAMYEAGYKNVYSMVNGFEGHKEKEGDHKGARVVNGWKNSGLPWGWKLNEEKMYVVIR